MVSAMGSKTQAKVGSAAGARRFAKRCHREPLTVQSLVLMGRGSLGSPSKNVLAAPAWRGVSTVVKPFDAAQAEKNVEQFGRFWDVE